MKVVALSMAVAAAACTQGASTASVAAQHAPLAQTVSPDASSAAAARAPAPTHDAGSGAAEAELSAVHAAGPSTSTSLGSVTNGTLASGLPVPLSGPGFHFNDRRSRDARYGTSEVVRSLVAAAAKVRGRASDSELVINDLSLPQGGRIAHHGSHRAGRDADILFYLRNDDGSVAEPIGAPIEPDGTGFDYRDLSRAEDDVRVHFDAQRTWYLIEALLENPEAPVQRIFVVEHLRDALLAAAKREKASASTTARFAEVSCQPGYPHDDHLHVRWFCSVEDLARGCEDLAPMYPWRAQQLTLAGARAVVGTQSRSTDPAPVTTQAEADSAVLAKAPHADVLAFLERRKAWIKQPHPKRKYCR